MIHFINTYFIQDIIFLEVYNNPYLKTHTLSEHYP